MKKTEFFDFVAQPNLLNEESLSALNEVVAEFPWFQSARMLLVKNLHVIDHVRFNGELKVSAAFIGDRRRLFQLVHDQQEAAVKEQEANTISAVNVGEKAPKEAQPEQRRSSVGLTTKVKSVADYFQTDDVFESSDGKEIDFSIEDKEQKKEENESAMVLPSADFLGYESADFVGYELKETIEPDKKKDESHSFSDWLTVLRHAPIEKPEMEKPVKKKSQQLIDNFLNIESPKIVARPNANQVQPSKIKATVEESTMDNELNRL